MQWPIIPIKNLTSLFRLIFLSKHISLHALGRLKWVLDIIWPLNQHFNLKNQRNWMKQVLMLSFLIGIICIILHSCNLTQWKIADLSATKGQCQGNYFFFLKSGILGDCCPFGYFLAVLGTFWTHPDVPVLWVKIYFDKWW